ncbi:MULTISPECIES: AtpZ/AtpI family protein [Edaphosphingomonas]|uniref:ATP synthase protein I n=2 Tax=Edaphosphingomonas TaxID=3423724 RepID=A0A2T4I7V2_9SPHN|nr:MULTISPECIES: AtpZ/AtpI family protein [Sphingomonas]MDX3884518.1 AtpZ/AtpI family protein [Sphingomonas sp.]OHT21362.1 putative F0F1-ATPase subunit [Sphingomonas haloaromaticamans]PTD27359.1 F0F1 ATP synthase assembly protein I [Sphingomonas fennica]
MAKDEPGQETPSTEDARLTSLHERLKVAADAERVRTGTKQAKPGRGYSQGNRVLAELIAGPAVGALVGWVLDRWLGTAPWLLLVMLFLGIAVAFRNIFRISNERPE